MYTRAERAKRIFAKLRKGWAYDEIGREEGISGERVRQIVQEVLEKRVIDRGEDHAHLQLARLAPALRVTAQAVKRGDINAVGALIKVLDRLDRYQTTFVAKYYYGEEERQKLLDKINAIADRYLEDPAAERKDDVPAGPRLHPAQAAEAPQ
jgi:hypothetical protein